MHKVTTIVLCFGVKVLRCVDYPLCIRDIYVFFLRHSGFIYNNVIYPYTG